MRNLPGPKPKFLDCNTGYGRLGVHRYGQLIDVDDLLAEMDRVGIDEALVYHSSARDFEPAYGNDRLLREVHGQNRLHPCWVLLPSHTGELPPPETLVSDMARNGVRAARIFPGNSFTSHRFHLAEWVVGDLLAALEEHRVPIIIDFNFFRRDEPDWDAIHSICSKHPRLPVIVLRIGGRTNRTLYPLLAACPNLHLGTDGYSVHQGIETICRAFGAERLVFSSGLPFYTAAGAVCKVTYANISLEDKQLIAGGNMQKLMEEVRFSAVA